MPLVLAILNVLVAIPKIGALIEDVVNAIVVWQINRQKVETLTAIADAAAFASRAETDEERFKAAQMWSDALKRPRVS